MMDIIERLEGLLKQATVERSHYYVGSCCKDAIEEIKMLRALIVIGNTSMSSAFKCIEELDAERATLRERVSELSWRVENSRNS